MHSSLSLPAAALSIDELDGLNQSAAARFTSLLEDWGHRMIWIPEVNGREAFTAAALVLNSTQRMVIGNGVARAQERIPKSAASAARDLSADYPGRYVLGLGVSGTMARRGAGPLPFMRGYLDGVDETIARRGGVRTDVPTVLGANSAGMTRLAVERTDGLITFLTTPEHTLRAREAIGSRPFLSVVQWAAVGDDPEVARETARTALAYYLRLPYQITKLSRLGFTAEDLTPPGSDRLVDALVGCGTPDDVRAAMRRQYEAGATQVALKLVGPLTDSKLDAYQALAP
jgi:probable F420-dependent oxidoreductase